MIKIGEVIYLILSGSTSLDTLIKGNIYPLHIPEKTKLPIIVYERRSNPNYSKDGNSLYSTIVDITILSNSYKNCIDICTMVDSILNNYKGVVNDIDIKLIKLVGVDELYIEETFIQKLSYEIKSK